jgi:Zn-dependent peptidase ImmA (M78 family)
MHELAHVICKHTTIKLISKSGITFREFDEDQEAEARWMGAALQVPRRGLMWALYRGMTLEMIAEHFGASPQLVRYRQNVTGAKIQLVRQE